MTWKVDPNGVKTVLGNVESASQPIFDSLGKIDAEVTGAAKGAQSQMILSALGEFFTSIEKSVTTIGNRVPAACDGAAAATMAIVRGDEEMAATAERNAQASALSGTFTAFGGER
ncbi:hypothetical protein GCM10025867_25620 [Frondihabitans sucicola]|uniref:ESX-1 secretion-associated protein n=1 Tax=Frondihabitans sucicola TaxID=1268041 RepID=A0ABN6XZG3_9MICO|nr:DUF6507 family protein [Frondihabitans sucicola]BDZ50321.1 hypothetical protein GCM10025867_25620 [Frondihabitans sucicola]